MKEKGTITEPCGNVLTTNASGWSRHSIYFYKKEMVGTHKAPILRTFCNACCVYWDKPYKKIEPVKDER